jgi:23S rRNA (uridine2552-2'-O)-methyltransferase
MLFRPTPTSLSKGSTSKAWVARQFSDPYVKKRLTDPGSYRSRAAFKLLEIDSQWGGFLNKPDVNVVVDLGAAPGGWSQVVAGKLGWGKADTTNPIRRGAFGYGDNYAKAADKQGTWSTPKKSSKKKAAEVDEGFDPLNIDDIIDASPEAGRGLVIAMDLLRMQPIYGVHSIQGDFLSPDAELLIQGLLETNGYREGKVDVVLSDMAANLTGNETSDTESSLNICHAVFEFARRHLRSTEEIGRKRGGVVLWVSSNFMRLLYLTLFLQYETFRAPSSAGISTRCS